MTERYLGYYDHERSDLLALIPPGIERALEVGCGTGGMARGLREKGVKELTGIEVNAEAAVRARDHFDRVLVGPVEETSATLPDGAFDLIIYGDVLEHLVDPWHILAAQARLLSPQGYVLLSVPNVRHWLVLYHLVVRGRWTYQREGGTLDRTHLRFFTRLDLRQMVVGAGYDVMAEGHNEFGRATRWMDRLSCGTLQGFLVWQYYVLARCRQPVKMTSRPGYSG
jgi:2-polyprenyl-3-methyl-5-hydroxy-6-metoxy-1,4-benzoquinol methylase